MQYTLRPVLSKADWQDAHEIVTDGRAVGFVARWRGPRLGAARPWQAFRGTGKYAFPVLSDGTLHGSACNVLTMWEASPRFWGETEDERDLRERRVDGGIAAR